MHRHPDYVQRQLESVAANYCIDIHQRFHLVPPAEGRRLQTKPSAIAKEVAKHRVKQHEGLSGLKFGCEQYTCQCEPSEWQPCLQGRAAQNGPLCQSGRVCAALDLWLLACSHQAVH